MRDKNIINSKNQLGKRIIGISFDTKADAEKWRAFRKLNDKILRSNERMNVCVFEKESSVKYISGNIQKTIDFLSIIEDKYKDVDLVNRESHLNKISEMKLELMKMRKRWSSSKDVAERLMIFSDISFFYERLSILITFLMKDFGN